MLYRRTTLTTTNAFIVVHGSPEFGSNFIISGDMFRMERGQNTDKDSFKCPKSQVPHSPMAMDYKMF